MIPATRTRVQENTDAAINERIHLQTKRNIAYFAKSGTDGIEHRLKELDREWD